MDALAQLPDYVQALVRDSPVLQRAVEDGVDLTLLLDRLSRTPTERIVKLQQSLAIFEAFRKAGQRKHGGA